MAKSTSNARKMKREGKSRNERLFKKRKMVMVAVDPNMMASILIYGTTEGLDAEGLPIDAVSLGWQYSPERMCLMFAFGHETFDAVKEGETIPLLDVIFSKKEPTPPQEPEVAPDEAK